MANLASAAILSPIAGRRALYRKGMINMFESQQAIYLSKASPGACQSLLRGFSLAFLYKYDWVMD